MGNKLYRTPNGNAVFVTRDGHVTLTNHSNLKENQVKFVNQEDHLPEHQIIRFLYHNRKIEAVLNFNLKQVRCQT